MPPPVIPADWTPESGYRAGRTIAAIPEVTAVFVSSDENSQYGPGHNSFVKAPDGTVLNFFHARSYRDVKGDPLKDTGRATRVQPLAFTPDGMPDFGLPQKEAGKP